MDSHRKNVSGADDLSRLSGMTTQDKHVTQGFSADRPASTDLLRRDRYVDAITNLVSTWTEAHSLVIGIEGPWGVGKTTLKDLVRKKLKTRGESAPRSAAGEKKQLLVVEFSPWLWSGQDQIFGQFFRQIRAELGAKDNARDLKEAANYWAKYAEWLSLGATAVEKTISLKFAALFGALGLQLLGVFVLPNNAQVFLAVLGLVLLMVPFLGDVSAKISELYEGMAKQAFRDLPMTRLDLHKHMHKSGSAVLVVIDDIDRLTPSEIRLVFQLVKANADFPRFIFLLLFERTVVESALSEVSGGQGASYLEKIIQVPLRVPPVPVSQVQETLDKELRAIFSDQIYQQSFEVERCKRQAEHVFPFGGRSG